MLSFIAFVVLAMTFTVPAWWIALLVPITPVIAAAAVKPENPNDRLRAVLAGLASVALIVINQLNTGTVDVGALVSMVVFSGAAWIVKYLAYRFGWSHVDINDKVLPAVGV